MSDTDELSEDASPEFSFSDCRVLRLDDDTRVCLIHQPACIWSMPFENECGHPDVDHIPVDNSIQNRIQFGLCPKFNHNNDR